jgi:hypothetical protein
LALIKERAYYKAVRQAITALGSREPLKEKLDTIARLLSRSFDTGACIVLLDSTRKHLAHTASWKLPLYYLRKGQKSLSEVEVEKPVFIEDVPTDPRIQYREALTYWLENNTNQQLETVRNGHSEMGLYNKNAALTSIKYARESGNTKLFN